MKTTQPYYHRNQQYSIVGLTNAAGTLVERYTYTAYGTLGIYAADGTVRTASSYSNRYTYTGREYDPDLKLYHFRARWYDPATGGFISRDPLGYVDGMSLYIGYFAPRGMDPHGRLTVLGKDQNGIRRLHDFDHIGNLPPGVTITFPPKFFDSEVPKVVLFGEEVDIMPIDATKEPELSDKGCSCSLTFHEPTRFGNPVYPPGGTTKPVGRQYLDVGIPCYFGSKVIYKYATNCVKDSKGCCESCNYYVAYSCTRPASRQERGEIPFIEWRWEITDSRYSKCQ